MHKDFFRASAATKHGLFLYSEKVCGEAEVSRRWPTKGREKILCIFYF